MVCVFKKNLLTLETKLTSENKCQKVESNSQSALEIYTKDWNMSDEEKAAGTGSGISTPTKCKLRRFQSKLFFPKREIRNNIRFQPKLQIYC